jgi:hypothetical protein
MKLPREPSNAPSISNTVAPPPSAVSSEPGRGRPCCRPVTPTAAGAEPSGPRALWALVAWLGVLGLFGLPTVTQVEAPAPPPSVAAPTEASDQAAAEARLADDARYLASDELEGRGLGTEGLDLAADYIAERFREAGLKTELFDGRPFQQFAVTIGSQLGREKRMALVPPPAAEDQAPEPIELTLGKDFSPLAMSGSADLDLPLVFAGYGITAKEEGYDDYEGIDVRGKAVIVLRHQPQRDDAESVFGGATQSPHAWLNRKVFNAHERGAAAVVFCTGQFEIESQIVDLRKNWKEALDRLAAEHEQFNRIDQPGTVELESHRRRIAELMREVEQWDAKIQEKWDEVLPFAHGGRGPAPSGFPVLHVGRAVVDRAVRAALGKSLGEIERAIDEDFRPQSAELSGWRIAGRVDVGQKRIDAQNVVAVLEGQGPLAGETIVVGAHYDHLGRGEFGSLSREKNVIHPGADDNASGVAVMLEVARRLAARPEKLPRRVVFVAFTGEERGLFGSNHYVRDPLVPIEKTVAMINLDMVGRLRDDKLYAIGAATGRSFVEMLDRLNEAHRFDLVKGQGGSGPSDQAPFYARKVPVLHFFTGIHGDYHRPSDTFEKLNVPGMRRVAELVADVAVAVAEADEPPEYVAVAPGRTPGRDGRRPFLGTMPDFAAETDGYAIADVVGGGPAEAAGLRAGDVIVRLGEAKIGGLDDIDAALRKHKGGDRVAVVVRRGEEEITLELTLGDPR